MVFLAFYKNHIKVRNGDTATFMTANSGRQLGKRRKLTHKKKKQKNKKTENKKRMTDLPTDKPKSGIKSRVSTTGQ